MSATATSRTLDYQARTITTRLAGRCQACRARYSFALVQDFNLATVTAPAREHRIQQGPGAVAWLTVRCDCGKAARLMPVLGKHNAAKVCDGRCMGAVGPSCECSCGGANHGARFALAG